MFAGVKVNELSVIIPVVGPDRGLADSLDTIPREDTDLEVLVVESEEARTLRRSLEPSSTTLWMKSAGGRFAQMNAGVEASSGDILVFLYAGTRLEEGWPEAIRQAVRQPYFALGSFRLHLAGHHLHHRLRESWTHARTGLGKPPRGEEVFFVKRRHFIGCAGYPTASAQPDLALARNLMHRGKFVRLELRALVPLRV